MIALFVINLISIVCHNFKGINSVSYMLPGTFYLNVYTPICDIPSAFRMHLLTVHRFFRGVIVYFQYDWSDPWFILF